MLDDENCSLGDAVDICLKPGQISIHDLFMVHGSAPNSSGERRVGMTYRHMPTTSFFDHDWAAEMTQTMGTTEMSQRPLFLVHGADRCRKYDFKRGHEVYHSFAC